MKKVVILAAGKGLRMGELTKNCPKPLLKVSGKTLLEHKLDVLPADTEEVIFVVNYLGDQIRNYFGNSYKGIQLRYVEADMKGTGFAIQATKPFVDGNFLVMMGDDLYHKKDIEDVMKNDFAVLIVKKNGKFSGGHASFDNGRLVEVKEGTFEGETHMLTGLYALTPKIFDYPMVPISPTEFGLPQAIASASNDVHIHVPIARAWIPVGRPEDIIFAEKALEENPRLFFD